MSLAGPSFQDPARSRATPVPPPGQYSQDCRVQDRCAPTADTTFRPVHKPRFLLSIRWHDQMASVRIVELGPRDGLQNVKPSIPSSTKLALIERLHDAGLQRIEVTSVVSPRAVPQLADCETILANANVQKLLSNPHLRTPILIPNLKGLDVALRHSVKEVAVFVSASEGFSRANIRCSVQEGLDRARAVTEKARTNGLEVRGYISCVFACPFDGPTPHTAVLNCVHQLLDMGCYEISLGDTIGVGVPTETKALTHSLIDAGIPIEKLAGHFHDTYGQAIANMWAAYHCGMRVFDSSVGGLGGCPYAPGAKGNLATEDLVYTLERAGISTGVDLSKLVDTGVWITEQLGIPNSSRAGAALYSKAQTAEQRAGATVITAKPPLPWTLQPDSGDLELYRQGPNLKLVLKRPRNGNALNASMISRLTQVFEDAAADRSITRIVITANGKYFCTGMDLSRDNSPVAQEGTSASDAQYDRLMRLFEAIDNAPQVTIACIQGPAFGGGVGLALVCDIRLMAANASLRLSEVRLGLAPATISKYVVRELGISFSREMMLSARPVSAQELLQLGVIAEIIPANEQPSSAIDKYLGQLQACAPRASTLSKELVRLGWKHAGDEVHVRGVKNIFTEMMGHKSESAHGLAQFQKGMKDVDWDAYTLSKAKAKAKPRL
ncbi:Hydroxymethylglutaryl-CoA lyase, mitochondrial [Cercospora beticola]|uniref:hydroxymethylglutaryl-CoA lyase n=1 Tax=Cercospora beticola TaxID=122368 RepID=A0A2G5HZS5_CERBT|nr:Hydroxymethylglutaryl-CoA lyase, mitochondrial [Cercospora beticola]PIA98049.1 Hydroxymethylglutaryl-CoA lyase, mitochondrial [Cercospora beticola]WPA98935.1 hypothetical protein RHO25_003548 [Cercospora beticola]CAK1360232.1 unnamed protein product [Cercospora beticola]